MKLTTEEKIKLCSGADFWHTKEMRDIPALTMSDGPHGLRKQEETADMLGIHDSVPATCFPTAVSTACSFDEELLTDIGRAIGEEAAAHGVGLLLGPGANIKRNPLCGRNFEYFSEDPHLTGKLAAGFIRGVESTGVGACLKHFALNNQEYKRFSSDSVADERTMREIYLSGFETAVKEGKPSAVMCAYNKINGVHCSDNKELLTDILRTEWGFDGAVVTDWGAMSDRSAAFRAGCDLCMPGGSAYGEAEALAAVKDGTLDESVIDESATRIEKLARRGQKATANATPADREAHYALAKQAATESAVLLKNDGKLLPLSEKDDVVFIGQLARNMRYQGAGSSHINPWKLTSPCDACPDIPFYEGYAEDGEPNAALLREAVSAAGKAKVAVVFAGLTDRYESEGFDRENMDMPTGQNELIKAVAEANSSTVVVLFSGSPVEIPWAEKVRAILYMGLPGEAGGDAVRDLLFGNANPCGKLAETWPVTYADCVSNSYYAGTKKDAHYREGVYVGYRYYATAGVPVRYPFGFGLSYTEFAYSDIRIDGDIVSCTVTNVGKVAGKEIVELFVAPPKGDFYRPMREMKGFFKVFLAPGESKRVSFVLSDRSFAVWNGAWVVPGGTYTVFIGGSSENLPLSVCLKKENIPLPAPNVPAWYHTPTGVPSHGDFEALVGCPVTEKMLKKGNFTMENSVMEMKNYSFMMKIMYKAVENTIAKGFGGKKDYGDPAFRMMMTSATDCSLSGMKINGAMNNHVLEGMLEIANGHFLRGIGKMMKK